jgi:hypothetical protein
VGIHVQALEFVGEGVADEVVAMGQETSAQTDAVERQSGSAGVTVGAALSAEWVEASGTNKGKAPQW